MLFVDLNSSGLENDPCTRNILVQAKNATQVPVNTGIFQLLCWVRVTPSEVPAVGGRREVTPPLPQRNRGHWLWLGPGRCTVIAQFSSFLSLKLPSDHASFITKVTKIAPSSHHLIHAMWLPSHSSPVISKQPTNVLLPCEPVISAWHASCWPALPLWN